MDVVVLDAAELGEGGSGLNGGQVIPGVKHDPDTLEHMFGAGRRRSAGRDRCLGSRSGIRTHPEISDRLRSHAQRLDSASDFAVGACGHRLARRAVAQARSAGGTARPARSQPADRVGALLRRMAGPPWRHRAAAVVLAWIGARRRTARWPHIHSQRRDQARTFRRALARADASRTGHGRDRGSGYQRLYRRAGGRAAKIRCRGAFVSGGHRTAAGGRCELPSCRSGRGPPTPGTCYATSGSVRTAGW